MIDLEREELIPLKDLARHLPRNGKGKPVAVSTLWRWATGGVRGVVLETLAVGGQRFTSVEAWRRFVAAGNAGKVARPDLAREAEATNRRLEAAGW